MCVRNYDTLSKKKSQIFSTSTKLTRSFLQRISQQKRIFHRSVFFLFLICPSPLDVDEHALPRYIDADDTGY